MPNQRLWFGAILLSVSPLGFATQNQSAAPNPVKAPDQPSAALLEFIGDWNDNERQLIGMETQAEQSTRKPKTKEVRRAP